MVEQAWFEPGPQSTELHTSMTVPSSQWQVSSFGPVPGGPQVPLRQLPLQHCGPLLQCFPLRLQPEGAAAPINLSALPREMLPLASPLASSSKELSLASGDILAPLSPKDGTRQPRQLANGSSMMCYKIWRNFREHVTGEVHAELLLSEVG